MSFQQGLSGLSAASKNLEVIGNNVANSNTYGEKSSRAEFADMYASAMTGSSGNAVQAGIGVQVSTVSQQFNQGNITPTGNPLDLAINGNGFFQTQDPSNQTQYTRNGQFKVSSAGNIVNDQGNKLLGYPADAQGNVVQGAAQPLQLPTGGIDPQQTTKSTMEFNLDARAAVEDAERFGDEQLQHPIRQLLWWGFKHEKENLRGYSEGARLGVPIGLAIKTGGPLVAISARLNEASDPSARAALAALPALLDQVDAYIADGTIGGPERNAADLQIATSIGLALTLDDLKPLIEPRPAATLAHEIVPNYPGHTPPILPPAWLPAAPTPA